MGTIDNPENDKKSTTPYEWLVELPEYKRILFIFLILIIPLFLNILQSLLNSLIDYLK